MVLDTTTGKQNGDLVVDLSTKALPSSENGWPPCPFQIVSLLDMVDFPLTNFVDLYLRLTAIQNRVKQRKPLSQAETEGLLTWVATIQNVGDFCDIDLSYFCNRIVEKVQDPARVTTKLHELLSQLRAGWHNELRKRKFMYVPMIEATFLDQDAICGTDVAERMPGANDDIKAAGNCYGTGNYTAAVFHLMRVSEFGLRRVAKKLNVRIKNRAKFVPLEYGTWDDVITACKNKITKIRTTPVGPKKQAALEFYSDAADHCLFMKDIWRNNVSHTRKPYNQSEALAVLARVKDFMMFLAANVS